jgi:hypothetical protein
MRAAARLYPRWWRARYAREFDALLDDVEPGWSEFFNILFGAVNMQMQRAAVVAVVCSAIGGLIAGALSLRMPDTYATSADLRLTSTDDAFFKRATAATAMEPLEVRIRTAVTIKEPDPKTRSTTLTVSFADSDPARALQGSKRLFDSIRTANGMQGTFKTTRTGPNRPMVAGAGGTVGLMLGALLVWFRREPKAVR